MCRFDVQSIRYSFAVVKECQGNQTPATSSKVYCKKLNNQVHVGNRGRLCKNK